MRAKARARLVKVDRPAEPASDAVPEREAWARNARATLFSKDWFGSTTRDRVPLPGRVAFDALFGAIRERGSLAPSSVIVRDAKVVLPGLVESLFVAGEDGRLVLRNDWIDAPEKCAASERWSDAQRKRADGRWGKR